MASKREKETTSVQEQEQTVLLEDLDMDNLQTEESASIEPEEAEKETTENSTEMEEDPEVSFDESFSDIDKENSAIDNVAKTIAAEVEKSQTLNPPLVLIANDINLQS